MALFKRPLKIIFTVAGIRGPIFNDSATSIQLNLSDDLGNVNIEGNQSVMAYWNRLVTTRKPTGKSLAKTNCTIFVAKSCYLC